MPIIVFDGPSAPPASATSYTLSGPGSGANGSPSTNFTVTPNGLYTGTITPQAVDGTFSPPSLTWSNESSAKTFTYTPASAGTKSISTTSSPGLTDPAPLSFTVLATAITITGPTSGAPGIDSLDFTATPNGVWTGTLTITETTGGYGVVTTSPLSWSSDGSAKTFKYRPPSLGTYTLHFVSSPSLTNPADVSYAAVNATSGAALKWVPRRRHRGR